MPLTKGTGEDLILSLYSIGEVEFPPETMDDDRILSQRKNGEDRIMPENKNNERDPSLNKNGEEWVPPNKQQIDNQRLTKGACVEVCTSG